MLNQMESGRFTRKTHVDWDADLDERSDRAGQLDDVPLRLTEERFRAETDRSGNVEPIEGPPQETSTAAAAEPPILRRVSEPAPEFRPEPPASAADAAGEVPLTSPNESARHGSILGLDGTQFRKPQSTAAAAPANRVEPWSGVRTDAKGPKKPRRSRVLWEVIVALAIALTAESGYAYLAVRRNSVNVSQLPGVAVIRSLGAEMRGARSRFQRSSLSGDLNAVGHEASVTLNAAYQGARRLAGELRDRYNQRHDR